MHDRMCSTCRRPMVPKGRPVPPGHARHDSRRLCAACRGRAIRDGTLADHERLTYARSELLAEWALLAAEGYSRTLAAARLGITRDGLDVAIRRARTAAVRDPAVTGTGLGCDIPLGRTG